LNHPVGILCWGVALVCLLAVSAARAQGGTPPETVIESGPSGTQRSGVAAFSFSSPSSGVGFQCRLDGASFAPCGASPSFQVANGRHDLEVRAVDGAGNADPTPASRQWWADALVANGNFEASLRGWSNQGYTLPGWKGNNALASLLEGGGLDGGTAARLAPSGTGTMAMYGSPRPINAAVVGTTYTAQGHVRSDDPGQRVCLRLREWANKSTLVGNARACGRTTTSWAAFPAVNYTIKQAGTELDIDVYQSDPTKPGDSFEVDGISLSDGAPTSVPPVPAGSGDPVLLAAGDVSTCWSSGDESVSRLLDTLAGTIALVGDSEQVNGSPDEYACYDQSWGRHLDRTKPAVGDHEYRTPNALGYFGYFGSLAGETGKGWYSYERGAWHIVVLNSNCGLVGGCGPGSEQYEWLRADLEATPRQCIGAYFHHPLFSAGAQHGGLARGRPFWDLLYAHGAEWVLGGNDHNYQRFARQTPSGERDSERGIRQFVVGTGGAIHYPLGPALPNTEVQNSGAFGVLKLTLHDASYDWAFVPQTGRTFTDSGSAGCSPIPAPDTDPPETTIDAGPSGTVESISASFGFSSDEAGSFECSLDGQPFVACSSPRDYANLSEGDHAFAVRAIDEAGNVDPSPATRSWTIALPAGGIEQLPNGSFESGLDGWRSSTAALSALAGGTDGQQFARVSFNATGTAYSLVTRPFPVSSPPSGARYEATAWVRSETPGKTVCLNVREWSGSAVVGSTKACRTTSGTWEPLSPAPYTAVGGDSIDINVSQSSATAGNSFDLDGVRLSRVP
jgi:hypothetical protein